MENYTTLIANSLIDDIQLIMIRQWRLDKLEYKPIQNVRFIPDKYSTSNHFPTDFMYVSFQFPNKHNRTMFDDFDDIIPWDDMKIRKVSEPLLTSTHFLEKISKN